ncbi:c-type cytochrome [Phenylobacterium sp.]|jgi:cytochrome c2|uniref:c-type cytochrome n=1 Tax=Phenylobacterium sp. TaxID=1871053 RepID=UPI002F927654
MARRFLPVLVAMALIAVGVGLLLGEQHERRSRLEDRVVAMTGGDPQAGRAAIQKRPCGSCHTIPGISGAKASVGPPLTQFGGRGYIAGRLENTPDNLVRWLKDPHQVDPQSAMPRMGIGEKEARDMAAYLYTLT